MLNNKLITPEGTKDYLFEEAQVRFEIETKLVNLFETVGYKRVATPGIEFVDVFSVKEQGIQLEQMYKFTDFKGRLLAVRPDTTLPIVRLVATRLKAKQKPLRMCYSQPIFLAQREMTGNRNEILQTGVELIGNSSYKSDIEIVTLALNCLKLCGNNNFRLEIGHIGVFNSLVKQLNATDEQIEEIRMLIESKNYPALNDYLDKYENKEIVNVLKQLPRMFGGDEVFDKALALVKDNEEIQSINYLKRIMSDVKKSGLDNEIIIDLGLVNRNDYYTGIVFKGYIEGYGKEVLNGGRYDNLVEEFIDEKVGAIGFAVDVDATALSSLSKNKVVQKPSCSVVFCNEGDEIFAFDWIDKNASKENVIELSLFETLEETIEYAKRQNIDNVISIAENKVKKISMKGGKDYE